MKKVMTYETLRRFAYSNDHLIEGEIRGIIVEFYGLGNGNMQNSDSGEALEYAAQNLLYVVPYNNPWCWMNDQAVHYTDEILDVLREHYGLSDQIGVVSTGGSMGGLSALVYTANSRTTPIACVANCPVCDLPYHFTEREDLPRTLYSAYGNEEGESLEDVLRLHSPVHMVDRMPRIPYTVLHCEKDTRVNLERHSELFVKLMEEAKQDITFIRVPLRPHCRLAPTAQLQYQQAILKAFD